MTRGTMEKSREPIKELLQLVVFVEGPQRPPKRVGVGLVQHFGSNCLRFERSAHAMPNLGPAMANVSSHIFGPPAEPKLE